MVDFRFTGYQTKLEVTESEKHTSLPRHRINYRRKKFYERGPGHFMSRENWVWTKRGKIGFKVTKYKKEDNTQHNWDGGE